jgi:SAM-dependent methyltransferase
MKTFNYDDRPDLTMRNLSENTKNIIGQGSQYAYKEYIFNYQGGIPDDTNRNQTGELMSELESFLLNKAPQFLATQERFVIFQKILRDIIQPNNLVASIPSGLMDDLLTLRGKIENVTAYGIDLDHDSLEKAIWNYQKLSADPLYNSFAVKTELRDAFDLQCENRFDIITSNGLNIYINDDDKVMELYTEFNKALKPGGHLLTSHLVYPPHEYDDENYELTKAIFYEIAEAKFNPRSVEACVSEFFASGFDVLKVEFDSKQLYPTFLCKKKEA